MVFLSICQESQMLLIKKFIKFYISYRGTNALWVSGDRSFHCTDCLLGETEKSYGLKFTAIEIFLEYIDGINFDSYKRSENEYMKFYSFDYYFNLINEQID